MAKSSSEGPEPLELFKVILKCLIYFLHWKHYFLFSISNCWYELSCCLRISAKRWLSQLFSTYVWLYGWYILPSSWINLLLVYIPLSTFSKTCSSRVEIFWSQLFCSWELNHMMCIILYEAPLVEPQTAVISETLYWFKCMNSVSYGLRCVRNSCLFFGRVELMLCLMALLFQFL